MVSFPSRESGAWDIPQAHSLAFAEFYTEVFTHSVPFIQTRFRVSYDDAEDIVQVGFLKAWENHPGFVDIVSPMKFVRTCIVYEAMDYLRKRRSSPVLSAQPLVRTVAAQNMQGDVREVEVEHQQVMSSEETYFMQERMQEAATALHQLPHLMQVMVQMSASGYGYDEIARHVDQHYNVRLSLRGVDARLLRARQEMRQQLHVTKVKRRGVRLQRKRLQGKWSRQYAACIVCGTTTIPHCGSGKCDVCYDKQRHAHNRQLKAKSTSTTVK